MAFTLAPCKACGEVHPEEVLKCPREDSALPLTGRLLDRRFRLLKQLGAGGMATVWRARNLRVDRDVAIKLIRSDLVKTEEMLARFRDEARAAGRIGSAHICEIMDLGSSPIGPYLVMELLEGMSLGELIKQEGKLSPEWSATIAREALKGLAAAHEAGIVHRDLTPGNIFIQQPEGKSPTVKLMDFGVSKFMDGEAESTTEHGALLGTPEYMSPEQVSGAKNVDHRTDIWAMGAILFRALTGEEMFKGPTVGARLVAVSLGDPRSVHELEPDVPDGLNAIVDRCMAKDPDERYQSAKELGAALEAFALPVLPVLPITARETINEDAPTVAREGADPDRETVMYAPTVPEASAGGEGPPVSWKLVVGTLVVVAAAVGVGMATRGEPEEPEVVDVKVESAAPAEEDPPTDQPARASGKKRRGRKDGSLPRAREGTELPSLDEDWEPEEDTDEPEPEEAPGELPETPSEPGQAPAEPPVAPAAQTPQDGDPPQGS